LAAAKEEPQMSRSMELVAVLYSGLLPSLLTWKVTARLSFPTVFPYCVLVEQGVGYMTVLG
jgi:hypothetical protein